MIRKNINRFLYDTYGIRNRDLDIIYIYNGVKYRIPQFNILWIILQLLWIGFLTLSIISILIVFIIGV